MRRVTIAIALSVAAAGCEQTVPAADAAQAEQVAAPEYLNPNPRAPYSEGVKYDGIIYLAGKTGGAGESGVQAETRRTLESIQDALERFGSSMDRVLKCTVFLTDMSQWSAMNEVYGEFFPDNKPARTTVGISLGGDTQVEIECMAAA